MKKLIAIIFAAIAVGACQKDDEYTLDYFTNKYQATESSDNNKDNEEEDTSVVVVPDTFYVSIAYNGSNATVTGDVEAVNIAQAGADIIIYSTLEKYLQLTLSGTTTDGSLLVFSQRKFGIVLNGVSLTNLDGPAINNQCGKSLYVTLADGTENTLTDGTTYGVATANGVEIDQKGALFSEGQIYFNGNGTLNVNGNAKNGIASDDYINFEGGTINVNVAATGSNGVKANDGVFIIDGVLNISVKADGARGIKNDARMEISGGTTTISTSGDCKIETIDGVKDTTSCAGIKCDSLFTMTAGMLTIKSTGDGGKGINASEAIEFKGGTLDVQATGSEDVGKPKAVKSDVSITLSGGSFHALSKKSKATDNAGNDKPNIVGTPTKQTLTKKEVTVVF